MAKQTNTDRTRKKLYAVALVGKKHGAYSLFSCLRIDKSKTMAEVNASLIVSYEQRILVEMAVATEVGDAINPWMPPLEERMET